MGWAKRLKRVFDINIQICSKCGGQIKIISSILNPLLIKRILTPIGENSTIPELSPHVSVRSRCTGQWADATCPVANQGGCENG